ncbi:hypothetical protein ACVWZV_004540 [Bradyrhizobium sp. GM5.1]
MAIAGQASGAEDALQRTPPGQEASIGHLHRVALGEHGAPEQHLGAVGRNRTLNRRDISISAVVNCAIRSCGKIVAITAGATWGSVLPFAKPRLIFGAIPVGRIVRD